MPTNFYENQAIFGDRVTRKPNKAIFDPDTKMKRRELAFGDRKTLLGCWFSLVKQGMMVFLWAIYVSNEHIGCPGVKSVLQCFPTHFLKFLWYEVRVNYVYFLRPVWHLPLTNDYLSTAQ